MNQNLTPRFYANIYAILATIIAIGLLVYYPNLNSPHESQHFMRGMRFSLMYQDGTLPSSLFEFLKLAAHKSAIVTSQSIELSKNIRIPFVSSSNVSVYPFTDYAPQIIAGTVGSIYDISPYTLFHLTRALCLTFAILGGYGILRLLPAYHLPVMAALLFPSQLIICIMQYTDPNTVLSSFLYFALLMRALTHKKPLTYKDMGIFTLTAAFLSASKVIYFPLTLAILLIPTAQFASAKHRMAFVSFLVIISLAVSFCCMVQALRADYGLSASQTLPVFTNTPAEKVENAYKPERVPRKQARLRAIFTNPVTAITGALRTYFRSSFWKYQSRDIFIWHGDRDNRVMRFTGTFYLLLALTPFFLVFRTFAPPNPSQPPKNTEQTAYFPSVVDRLICLYCIAAVAVLLHLTLYTGTVKLSEYIQGRYLLPLLPYAAFMLSIRFPRQWYGPAILFQMVATLSVACVLYLTVLRKI